jgi:hypothetical protein
MNLLFLLFIPVSIAGGSFFLLKDNVTWKEFLLQVVLGAAICGVSYQVAKWGSLQDTEHLNGRITRKIDGTQSCCHCRTVCDARNKKGECTSSHVECDHIVDYYWDLDTSVGKIPIEDCSGSSSPPLVWSIAVVGEPAAVDHMYTNYLLADSDSLMVHGVKSYLDQVPNYPDVRAKYHVDHVIGDQALSAPFLQEPMRELNADVGPTNQVDVTLLLTSVQDPAYAQAVESKWLYGPKNSITIVAGLQGDLVQWVRVVTFSKVEMLKVRLRDQLQGLSIKDPQFMAIIRREVTNGFRRTAMADFEYLAATASPHGWQLALLILFEVLSSVGLAYWANVKDIFGDERLFRSRSFKGGFSRRKYYDL